MKNQAFLQRVGYAVAGCKVAFRSESSFRTHVAAAVGTLFSLCVITPRPVWWAIIVLVIALVLALEMLNTALEFALDGLHPERADFVRHAKDCAAGGVFLLSGGAVAVYAFMLWDTFR